MFEIGWSEMLVIAVVLIVVVGPKDLPKMLRTFGRMTSKMRVMAGDFRKQFDEAMKEAELDDVKSLVDDARKLNPTNEIRKAMNPMQKAADDVRAGLASLNSTKPSPAPDPAPSQAQPAEPAKPGPAAIPGETQAARVAATTPEKKAVAATASRVGKSVKPAATAKAAKAKPDTGKAKAAADGAKAKPAARRKPAATKNQAAK